ncbi:hypothetical protein IVB30_18740 [Bradyrhizobium sp. 200]|uniref:hypothetical protein n=1 Tax=Bradyrhizobium sp. 200 TaxID=2782665 RepID=UPI001FFE855F|nr:hypothetical protein [Bradyrhizobium sp. 200]UPJ53166.1 hypothetical protein IVB30_18740 [Bradyrhizobium sp. 200]
MCNWHFARQSVATGGFINATRLAVVVLAAVVLLFGKGAYAAQVEWTDPISCNYKIRFDPKKHDAARVLNTADFVFESRRIPSFPIPDAHIPYGISSIGAYREACSRHADLLTSLPLVDLPGLESYRDLKIEQLKDWCDFGTALIHGHLGDIAALRAFEPSAAQCSGYVDALEGKTDIRRVWRELVVSSCQNNSRPEECKARFLSAEGRPDEAERIRKDVLSAGWRNCSTPYLKTGNSVSRTARSMQAKLELSFRKRFRMTRAPCAD